MSSSSTLAPCDLLVAGAAFGAGAIFPSALAAGWVDWAIDGAEASRPTARAAAVSEASVK